MSKVDCMDCIYFEQGMCVNISQPTYCVRMHIGQNVVCEGFRCCPSRDAFFLEKKIRKVKSIYDFERINVRTLKLKVKY